MMTDSNIAAAYDVLAERWLDANFDQSNGAAMHWRALSFLRDKEKGTALNVGCGCNTRFNAVMRERGLALEGIDISSRMVELARKADPDATIYHADACTWTPTKSYDFVTAWDSIWHVNLTEQRPLMLKLMGALEVGGVFLFTAGGLDTEGWHVDDAMGPQVYYSTLGMPGLLKVIDEAGCVCRHLEFDQLPHPHLAVIVQRMSSCQKCD